MINMIVAMDEKGLIGNKGELPWHIPEDLKLFKENTVGTSVIMGRKTFESIGRPLPKRDNIVISSKKIEADGIYSVQGIPDALTLAQELNQDVFIIGGGTIYSQCLPYIDSLYISFVRGNYEGDTYFPEFDATNFEKVEKIDFKEFTFTIFKRKKG